MVKNRNPPGWSDNFNIDQCDVMDGINVSAARFMTNLMNFGEILIKNCEKTNFAKLGCRVSDFQN